MLSMAADYEVRDVDFYHRAVLKPAPTCFTVEVLPPIKQGKAHSYGIRVIPVNPKSIEGLDPDNDSVRSLDREYEVWRRWDDCLDFQDKIELEYDRMSREKKRGLVVGNGAKRAKAANGVYSNTQAASSFESLPEGPDPKSIAVDVHAYIPRLSKKTSVFKVSDATVQKRGEEFASLIYALFKADCPRLIMELRDTPNIRDFFGWWRRDKELWEKKPKRPSTGDRVSVSESTITLTNPPSPDSPGFSILKSPVKPQIHRAPSDASKSPTSPSRNGRETPTMERELERTLPSPPTSPEVTTSKLQRSRSPMAFLRPGSRDGARPQISKPIAHPLQELPASLRQDGLLSPPADPRRAYGRSRSPPAPNRAGRLFDPREAEQVRAQRAADASSDDSATPPATPTQDRPISTISMDSSYDIDLSFLKSAPAGRNSKRDSVASFASVDSVGTTCSADAVVPRGPRHRMRRGLSPWEPDVRVSMAVPEEEELDEFYDDTSTIDGVSLFDDSCSYLEKIDSFPQVPGMRPQYEDDEESIIDRRMSFPASIREDDNEALYAPPSPTIIAPSDSGHSTESMSGFTCSIKAKYDECIVALRIPMDMSLAVLRTRLVEKFSQVQGIRLRARFGLAYTPLSRLSDDSMPIVLSPSPYASFSTNGPDQRRPGTPDSVFGSVLTRLVPIWNQDDWELALDSCNGKLVLHILDTEVW